MMKRIFCYALLGMLLAVIPVSAHIGSLQVLETIPDGTLLSTWTETTNANWKGQNKSGVWEYNCTTTSLNWTINSSYVFARCYKTYEIKANHTEAGIGDIIAYIDENNWFGVLYYLEDPIDGSPGAFICDYISGVMYYWNGTGYEQNISNATDYAALYECDYTSSFVRVKSLINFGLGNQAYLKWKIWNPSVDEPKNWLIDDVPYIDTDTYKQGLCFDATFSGKAEADFRRIMFWNAWEDLDVNGTPIIVCPTITADTLFNELLNITNVADYWNESTLLKTFFNQLTMTSYFDRTIQATALNHNDSVYIFAITVTDFVTWFHNIFPAAPTGDIPNNILLFWMFSANEGSYSGSDTMMLRFDMDNDHLYDSNDYTYYVNFNNTVSGHFYKGTTQRTTGYWYGAMAGGSADDSTVTNIFRGSSYHTWISYLNLDTMYNGTHRLGLNETVGLSIIMNDANAAKDVIWQDWIQSNETVNTTASDQTNSWQTQTNATKWGHFYIDGTITGIPLDDPADPVTATQQVTDNLVNSILPIVLAIAFIVVLMGLIFTQTLTIESLIALMISAIIVVITIKVILGV